jgi:glutathione synthase/RimK-type ligase-like ATP-grasp enzyme
MIAVLYEHPEWFKPLFATLERRGLVWMPVDATSLRWDPTVRPGFDLLVNRMSPSAWTRGHGHAIQSTLAYLHYVERWGIPVVNGLDAWRLEISKSAQLDLFEQLGVPYPRARVINHASQAPGAADGLRYPVVVKPNIGGSGAGIQRFDAREALRAAVAAGTVSLGMDDTALVQEFLPADGGHITRLEILQHELLYAIRITPPKDHGFNLCPADICQVEDLEGSASSLPGAAASGAGSAAGGPESGARGPESGFEVCPVKPAMQIEAATAPPEVVRQALAISRAAGLDVCGIEFLVDQRDGRHAFYDVNALSNFVTDAVRVVGFDPFERLVDVIEARARSRTLDPVPASK